MLPETANKYHDFGDSETVGGELVIQPQIQVVRGAALFGKGSEFGFKNPLPFFNLLPPSSVKPTTNFGISSVSTTPLYPIRKSR